MSVQAIEPVVKEQTPIRNVCMIFILTDNENHEKVFVEAATSDSLGKILKPFSHKGDRDETIEWFFIKTGIKINDSPQVSTTHEEGADSFTNVHTFYITLEFEDFKKLRKKFPAMFLVETKKLKQKLEAKKIMHDGQDYVIPPYFLTGIEQLPEKVN